MISFGLGYGKSKSRSDPLSPDEVAAYYQELNRLSGGRLGNFARTGTQAVQYDALTPDELRNLGGAGATRRAALRGARADALQGIVSDPSLSVFQRTRARQLTNEEFADRLDAINQETEASLTGLASQENRNAYLAALRNSELDREDLEALANIFFGGKGDTSSSVSRNFRLSGSFASPGGGG